MMREQLKSELLKLKKSGFAIVLFICPLLSVFIAFLLISGEYLVSFGIYWWIAVFLPLTIGLLYLIDMTKEEKAGEFQNIRNKEFTMKILLAKMVCTALLVILANIVLVIGLAILKWLYGELIVMEIFKLFVKTSLINIIFLWNIRFLYFIGEKMNRLFMIVANCLINFLIAPFIAQTKIWPLFPYSYHYKMAYELLSLKPSGDIEKIKLQMDIKIVLLLVILSISLTIWQILIINRKVKNVKQS